MGGDIWDIKWGMSPEVAESIAEATWGACPSRSNLFGCWEPSRLAGLLCDDYHRLGRSMDCLWATGFRGHVVGCGDGSKWLKREHVTTKYNIYIYIYIYLYIKFKLLVYWNDLTCMWDILRSLCHSHFMIFSVVFQCPWTVPFPPVPNLHASNNRAGLRVQSLWSSSYVSSMSSDQVSNETDVNDNSTKGQALGA